VAKPLRRVAASEFSPAF